MEEIIVERRRGARFALKAAVSIRVAGQARMPARMLDVSSDGCRLMAHRPLDGGAAFWLSIANLPPRLCSVAWTHQRFAGVRFAVPLEPAELARLTADYGNLTEADARELRQLSQLCADIARLESAGGDPAQLAALAEDCRVEAEAFEQVREGERAAAVDAWTQALLARLSDRPGDGDAIPS